MGRYCNLLQCIASKKGRETYKFQPFRKDYCFQAATTFECFCTDSLHTVCKDNPFHTAAISERARVYFLHSVRNNDFSQPLTSFKGACTYYRYSFRDIIAGDICTPSKSLGGDCKLNAFDNLSPIRKVDRL